ncbi:MAG: TatD family hydrolase [Bacteroidales bacterium]|nr:TatD family hydrolase [Bacteroidales bacterium]MDZ4205406.1 TatD family hydrolase [Bacteroidales bacterium]
MFFVDTHTHLYLNEFDSDRQEVVQRAIDGGVKYMLLPNIDSTSIEPLHGLQAAFPQHCIAMMGLHPTSVKESWKEELRIVETHLTDGKYCAVGEVGLDFYWDQTYRMEQEKAFRLQIELAKHFHLPLVIHSRKALDEIIHIVKEMKTPEMTGVFHCYPGSLEQALQVVKLGFKLGIGGVVTYKNSALGHIIQKIGLENIVLETDSPFISPVPYRGKRNESAHIRVIAEKVAEILVVDVAQVAEITTRSAFKLFPSLHTTQ